MAIGYSGKTLEDKLGIKENFSILLYNQPGHYFSLFTNFPKDVEILDHFESETADFVHLFCHSYKELLEIANNYKIALKKNGLFWVSWPKGSSKIKTELNRDLIREYLIKIGLVDVKVVAIDQDWSGLKFVYRLIDR